MARREREHLDAIAVQGDLDLLRFAQPFEVLVAIAGEADLDAVLRIDRERMEKDGPAARAVWQIVEVLILGEIGGEDDRPCAGRSDRRADCQPRDLLRRRQVALEECRRQPGKIHVVETVARVVGRKQRGCVDVEREQIADRILILGPTESMKRVGPSRVGRFGRGPIERGDKI